MRRCPDAVAALATFCGEHGPRVVLCTTLACSRRKMPSVPPYVPKKMLKTCASCICLSEGNNLMRTEISADNAALSGNYLGHPMSEDLALRLLHATAKTFFAENAGTKMNLFTDGKGIVFAQKFTVGDHKEIRGFSRKLCVLLLSDDKGLLERGIEPLSNQAGALMETLKQMALSNYDKSYKSKIDFDRHMALRETPRNLREFTHPQIYSFVHATFAKMLWDLRLRRQSVLLCGPPFVHPSVEAVTEAALTLKDVARVANKDEFQHLLSNLANGVDFCVESSSESLLRAIMECVMLMLPKRRFTVWARKGKIDDGVVRGLFHGVQATRGDGERFLMNLYDRMEPFERVILHGTGSGPLEGLTLMSARRSSAVPMIARSITRLAYSEAEPEVVSMGVEALVERYVSWCKVWAVLGMKGGKTPQEILKSLNLGRSEEGVLRFWGTFCNFSALKEEKKKKKTCDKVEALKT